MVPEGWRDAEVGDFVREVVRRGGDGLPVLSVSKDLGIVLQTEKFGRILASDDRRRYKRVRRGEFAYDPMLLWSGSIARQQRVDEGVVSPVYHVFEVDQGSADPQFIEHVLTAERMLTRYEAISEGTNQRRRKAPFDGFERLSIPLPPLPEQRKIAAILSSVDDAIAATRSVIEQTERVKQGLLQTLMTRGIGHTRFKQTEIGELPEEWDVVAFGSLVEERTLGTSTRGDGKGATYDLIKMGNLGWGSLDLSEVEQVTQAEEMQSLRLEDGDFLFNTRNTPELVGKTAVWHESDRAAVPDNNLMRVRFDHRVAADFICGQMAHGLGRRRLRRLAAGSTSVAAIYWKDLQNYSVGLPPMEEQMEILESLRAVDRAEATARTHASRLQRLKRGLLQDLLTGRVRVTPD